MPGEAEAELLEGISLRTMKLFDQALRFLHKVSEPILREMSRAHGGPAGACQKRSQIFPQIHQLG